MIPAADGDETVRAGRNCGSPFGVFPTEFSSVTPQVGGYITSTFGAIATGFGVETPRTSGDPSCSTF